MVKSSKLTRGLGWKCVQHRKRKEGERRVCVCVDGWKGECNESYHFVNENLRNWLWSLNIIMHNSSQTIVLFMVWYVPHFIFSCILWNAVIDVAKICNYANLDGLFVCVCCPKWWHCMAATNHFSIISLFGFIFNFIAFVLGHAE